MPLLLDRAAPIDPSEPVEGTPSRVGHGIRAADLNRREVVVGGIALGAHALLAGRTPIAAAAAAVETRAIATDFGPVEVPANPQRVVCVHHVPTYYLIDVGIVPAAVVDYPAALVLPEYVDAWPSIPKVGSYDEIDLELVAARSPDLILGINPPWGPPPYDKLSEIAPTAIFRFESAGANWDQMAGEFGDAVGRRSEMSALQQRYEDRRAQVREQNGDLLGAYRWYLVEGGESTSYVYHATASHARILADAGVQFGNVAVGDADDATTGAFTEPSLEQINQLDDADVIGVQANNDGRPGEATLALVDHPAFKLLRAAKAGRVFPMTSFFACSYPAAIGLLDELEKVLQP